MSRPAPFAEYKDADAILNFIFDPSKSFIGASLPAPPKPAAAAAPAAAAPTPAASAEHAAHVRLSAAEKAAVALAEGGDAGQAIAALTAVVEEAPTRASAFNNRAQAHRMAGNKAAARADVDAAIRLGREWLDAHSASGAATGSGAAASSSSPSSLSATEAAAQLSFHRNVMHSAYTQRAILNHESGDAAAADADLKAAADFGGSLARMMTTGTNPYAAMCNTAIAKMLQMPEMTEEGGGEATATSAAAGTATASSSSSSVSSCAPAAATAAAPVAAASAATADAAPASR